jgi:hypothetical protein
MARSERNGADRTSTEARARFRETAEHLAVRLRWLSIVAIPAPAYLSAAPVYSPWFEIRSVDGTGTRVAAWVPEHNSGEGHGDSSLPR